MSTVGVSATFENSGEAAQIGIDICKWVGQRISNAGLRGEMNDIRKVVLFEKARRPVAIGKVQFHETKPIGFGELRTPRLFQTRIIIWVHVIEADNIVAV